MANENSDCEPPSRGYKSFGPAETFLIEGLGSEYGKLQEFQRHEEAREDINGYMLTRFVHDGSRSARKLARHGYLVASDIPHRYLLTEKARTLLERLGKD